MLCLKGALRLVNEILPISGVKVDVKIDDDCTITVIIAPISIAKYPVSHGAYGISAFITFLIIEAIVPKYEKM